MKPLRVIGTVLLILATLYLALSAFIGYRFEASSRATSEAMEAARFDCPTGTEPRTERWGKNGYSRMCASSKEGQWEAWEGGYKQTSGSYRGGKQDGRWTYYNQDGSVARVIAYKDGVEVPSSPAP